MLNANVMKKNLDKEAFKKVNTYSGLTTYDKIIVREVLLKVCFKLIQGKDFYKAEAENSESVEEAIFAEGGKAALDTMMEFVHDELNDFECPFPRKKRKTIDKKSNQTR